MDKTKEPQYSILYDVEKRHGRSTFGIMANESWNNDPKRTLFTLARYKFVARMLEGKNNALEIGCADAFGTRLVQQTVKKVHVIDFDPVFIEDVKNRYNQHWPLTYEQWDILKQPTKKKFESCFALDVLEHIEKENNNRDGGHLFTHSLFGGADLSANPQSENQTFVIVRTKSETNNFL